MTTRQEIYDRIRASSRDEVVFAEMIRRGFWPLEGEMPVDPDDEIRRRVELERQLRTLAAEQSRLQNVDALKRSARKRRMKASRIQRQETKQRRLQEQRERAEAWQQRKKSEILYLGDGVSAGLSAQECDEQKLTDANLPLLRSAEELARTMQISVGELRFLAFARRTATTTHYKRFLVPKKTGGWRQISAPMPRLKRAQEWVLANILEQVPLHRAAHGFRRGCSIVSNARPHVDSDVVINVDVENFFPTITYKRIKGIFRKLGYSESIAIILALICSEPEADEVKLDGRTYYVARGERFLPQGAPSSPALTNILCRGLDARLTRTAQQLGFTYTRYADDITFSGSDDAVANIGRALRRLRYAISKEGFRMHPGKTRILRRSRRQEVTGLVVNQRVNVSRKQLRRFRAALFQIERDGPAGKHWGNTNNVMAAIEGFANYVAMVDPEKGAGWQSRVRAIIEKHGRGSDRPGTLPPDERPHDERPRWKPEVTPAEKPPKKKKPWWKFW